MQFWKRCAKKLSTCSRKNGFGFLERTSCSGSPGNTQQWGFLVAGAPWTATAGSGTCVRRRKKGMPREGKQTKVRMEVIFDDFLRVWWCNFGTPGARNDIQILNQSQLFSDIRIGQWPKTTTELTLMDLIYHCIIEYTPYSDN
jgi:Plant transposon protein